MNALRAVSARLSAVFCACRGRRTPQGRALRFADVVAATIVVFALLILLLCIYWL